MEAGAARPGDHSYILFVVADDFFEWGIGFCETIVEPLPTVILLILKHSGHIDRTGTVLLLC